MTHPFTMIEVPDPGHLRCTVHPDVIIEVKEENLVGAIMAALVHLETHVGTQDKAHAALTVARTLMAMDPD